MKKTLYLVVFFFLAVTSYGQGYNRKTIKAIKRALGKDVSKFKFYSYPTDNYGVITSYTAKENDLQRICATWSCLGIDYAQVPKGEAWLKVNGYADTGAGGKEIKLSEEVKTDLSIKTVLPKIYDVLSIDGGFDRSAVVNTELKIGKVHKRSLDIDKVRRHFANSSNQTLKTAFDEGRLAYIVADIVIENMSVVLKVNATTAAKIDAKLEGLSSNVISDGSISVGFKREREGEYTFVFDNPVIVARIAKKQPAAQRLESRATVDTSTWIEVNSPDETGLKHNRR